MVNASFLGCGEQYLRLGGVSPQGPLTINMFACLDSLHHRRVVIRNLDGHHDKIDLRMACKLSSIRERHRDSEMARSLFSRRLIGGAYGNDLEMGQSFQGRYVGRRCESSRRIDANDTDANPFDGIHCEHPCSLSQSVGEGGNSEPTR